MKITKSQLRKIIKEELKTLEEDGHQDVASAARKLKTAIEDAGQILQGLPSGEVDLPAWWMSKITLAADYLNKCRDYLLVGGEVMEEKLEKVEGGWYVTSKSGRRLSKSPHKTKKAALAQLGAVEASKASRGS